MSKGRDRTVSVYCLVAAHRHPGHFHEVWLLGCLQKPGRSNCRQTKLLRQIGVQGELNVDR